MANWDFLREMDNLRREIDEAFRGAGFSRPFESRFLAPLTTRRFPLVNVSEDNDNLYVDALVPGVDPNDFELTAMRDTITISGERKSVEKQGGGIVHRNELGSGKFSRTLELPTDIAPDKINAECKDGIMHITLGKAEHAKPKKIEIKIQ